ncbi:MAG: GTP cyclohydrolase I FolE, partial [Ilumatobacteraceae bacterium]
VVGLARDTDKLTALARALGDAFEPRPCDITDTAVFSAVLRQVADDHGRVEVIRGAIFTEKVQEMVIVKDVEMYSLCEHHMIPFYGKAHVAYIPNGYITGLSKVARVVDICARRLQVQDRLTTQIRDAFQEALSPLGVAVVIEAKHLCMMMRGVEKQNSVTTTSAFCGAFEHEPTRGEFLRLLSSNLS